MLKLCSRDCKLTDFTKFIGKDDTCLRAWYLANSQMSNSFCVWPISIAMCTLNYTCIWFGGLSSLLHLLPFIYFLFWQIVLLCTLLLRFILFISCNFVEVDVLCITRTHDIHCICQIIVTALQLQKAHRSYHLLIINKRSIVIIVIVTTMVVYRNRFLILLCCSINNDNVVCNTNGHNFIRQRNNT